MAFSFGDRSKEVLVQSFLIVVSVLVALSLEEAVGNYKQEQERDLVVENIIAELRENTVSLERVLEFHREAGERIATRLDSLERAGLPVLRPAAHVVGEWTGGNMREPTLQRAAWETARLSPSYGLIPYEHTYQFAKLYDLQEDGVETMWRALAQGMIDLEAYQVERAPDVLRFLSFGFTQLHSMESFLLEETEGVLHAICSDTYFRTCPAER